VNYGRGVLDCVETVSPKIFEHPDLHCSFGSGLPPPRQWCLVNAETTVADPHCRLVTDLTRTTRAARTRTHPVRHEADSRRADARHATDVHLRSVRPTARPAKVRHIFDRGARAPQGHASGPSQATAGRGRDTVRVTSGQMAWVFFTSATGCF
jgi:hypothetical protein